MSLEFIKDQEKVDTPTNSVLVDDSYSQLKGGDQKLSKSDVFEQLDASTRETLYQALASINEIAQAVKQLPCDYRTGFQQGIAGQDGPAYEMFRKAFMA